MIPASAISESGSYSISSIFFFFLVCLVVFLLKVRHGIVGKRNSDLKKNKKLLIMW